MRIGLISDTHISESGEKLPPQIERVFAGVDLILHGGDLYLLSVLDELEKIAPVMAVRGNGDTSLPSDFRLNDKLALNVNGLRLGVTHGLDYPEPSWRSLEDAMQYEFGGRVDIFIFGDSHVALTEIYKGVLHINPGSPTYPRQIKGLGSVAILEVNALGEATAWIISISSQTPSPRIRYCRNERKGFKSRGPS